MFSSIKVFGFNPNIGLKGALLVQNHFKPRPTDIFLAAFVKCGTTWLRTLMFATMNRSLHDFSSHPLLNTGPHGCFPCLDTHNFSDCPISDLEAIPSPRLLATHIPYPLLPESMIASGCKFVYIWRDPKDVFVSMWYFMNKIKPKEQPPLSLDEAFDLFCEGISNYGPFWDHVLGYWKASQESPDNILFLRKIRTVPLQSRNRNPYSTSPQLPQNCIPFIVASSHRLIIFSVVPTPRRLSSFHCHIVSSSSSSFVHLEDCIRSFVTSSLRLNIFSVEMGTKHVAQKKTAKRKRDEYHVKEETQQTNTSTIVDMHNVNYRSNMTGLVKFMKTTKFTQAQLGCFRQTPFWNLLDTLRNNQIDLDKCMKYDDVVVHVLQMYKASKDAFYIGEKKMNIHNSDIKLIFGVDCGSKPMDIAYGAKPKTGIVNKICKNVSRLTSKWIRTLLTEALKGKKKADNEEVARLVCMYACQKLFFSTSGETIGWGYYAHMVPLETMREYDWAKQIRTTLTSSISQNDKNPAKVTGCVMLLMM
ncbi:hypothetical protein ACSBR1_042300 [Camellia fascicularis]